jgi:hypothetical protein
MFYRNKSIIGFLVYVIKLCVSLLSHDRYQYDHPIRSKHTGACPRQHLQQLLLCVALDRLVSDCCLNYSYKMTVQTSFSSEMELRLTGTWKFEIAWNKICPDIGLATQQTRTWHWHISHQEVRI